jgi:hypothetical protein
MSPILEAYLIFTKNHNGLQKVAQLAKIFQTGHTVDYSKSGFICPVANFIKLSWRYLRPQEHDLSQNLRQFAESGINYAKKVL